MRAPAEERAPTPQRPPGGNALLRVLRFFERSGYRKAAQVAIEAAVPAERIDEFVPVAARVSADPSGEALAVRRANPAAPGPPEPVPILEDVAAAYAAAATPLGEPTPGEPGAWASLGPTTIPNGQTYGRGGNRRINVSGRVSALALDPSNPQHVLAGAGTGGVWESTDGGASWQPRTDGAATLASGALAYDPHAAGTVYCGTGEANTFFFGAGVLRSVDGGTTWTPLCTQPFVGDAFYDLVVDPADRLRLVAGTLRGLYVSAHGGTTWKRARTAQTWSISIAPGGNEILAGCADGVFASTDSGTTWAAVPLPGAPARWKRLAVAIAPSNPDTAYAWGTDGLRPYLWRRAGDQWTPIEAPPDIRVQQGWYDWFLGVAPDRDSQIFCGAIDAHRGDLGGEAPRWANISSKSAGDSIHPDQHAIAFEPGNPDAIYIGNDGGVFRSPDRGDSWEHCNNGLVITEFEFIAQDLSSDRWLIGGTQDNGTERWTGNPVWEHVADGDGGACGVSNADPRTVYHTYYGMSAERSDDRGDWGTWADVSPPAGGEGTLFYPPLECSVSGGDTLAMGNVALYLSRDKGANWTRLEYPSPTKTSAMYIPTPDAVYVGLEDGRIFSTEWADAEWGELQPLGQPRADAYASDIYVDPDATELWVTYTTIDGGRVFRSDDGGATWTDCTAGLPNLPINAIAVDPADANRLWVGADVGVYESTDRGATWQHYSTGLPNVLVGDLEFHPALRVLRAATRSRGVWEAPTGGAAADA